MEMIGEGPSPNLKDKQMSCMGTWFSGGLGMLGYLLDSMVLEIFSNLNISMILTMLGSGVAVIADTEWGTV